MSAALETNGRAKAPAAPVLRIEVYAKPGMPDPAGAAVAAQMPLIGVPGVIEVRVGQAYEFFGRFSLTQAAQAAQQLLADPIIQEYALNGQKPSALSGPGWRIEVWLKPTVTDVAGESVRQAVEDLGLPAPEKVRCGTIYHVLGRIPQAHADKAALKLLANPIVHRYTVAPC